jgi:hypothetical protein
VTGRRWQWRVLGGLVLYAGLEVALTLLDFDPDPVRLALVVGVCVAAAGVLRDGTTPTERPWTPPPAPPVVPPGSDARLSAYVRLIEDHLAARNPDRGLRDRLVVLSGGRLADELDGPARRLTTREIDDYLTRIEEP